MLGITVVRPEVSETTALGAAYVAGLAVGVWPDTRDLHAHWKADKRWTPAMDQDQRGTLYASWKKAVGRSFDWAV
jgi:glycerol kinase